MKTRYMVIAAFFTGLWSAGIVYAASTSNISAQDFVTKASISSKFEVQSSRLASDRAQSGDVKSFAHRMEEDHNKIAQQLQETLNKSTSKAKIADKLDNKHEKLLDKLKGLSGSAFDKEYLAMQTDAHKEAVALFTRYSNHGGDEAFKDFATDTLPILEDHLSHVEKLKSKL